MWKLTTIILVLAFVALCNAQMLCESNLECPEDSFCSGHPKAVSKTPKVKKICVPCDCNEKDQCYFGGFNNLEILCDCADSGYTGATCETPIDLCDPNPCQNG
ncbi:delta and Notch-like epidermal growth factor-related receptor [Ruditapes philippinarum]|uniref:delta and Notch-like epidermal growth factor-related receptor n=1 Tax=Ruditapes philippinarum TaxID=129788 RepID=UPI00295B7AB6|nr:delta and Notch-like epidermal growth factor-related receptor [Ruditapes philippinarum]